MWGHFPVDFIAYPGYGTVDGIFQVSEEMSYPLSGGLDGNVLRKMEFNSALITRSGTSTHGKQKGVKFIIKVL